jgi:Domain of unknown function (DUF4185)
MLPNRPSTRVLLTVLAALFFAAHAHASATPCNAAFAPETGKSLGWQGADAAYSIPLPDGRDVWIFGDTLYGTQRVVDGNDPRMVHNSLGISTCSGGHWKLRYILRHDGNGQPISFFSPADHAHWYWALDGFYANGDLWVTLLCIRHSTKTSAPAGMDFETCGSDLAQISGLNRDPEHWQITVHPLVPDGVKAYPSATTVVYDGYAYLFALYENGTRPLLVTRIPLAGLNDPAAHLEYLGDDDVWHPGFDPAHAKQVMSQGSPELSIRYHPELKQWLAVSFDPAVFSDRIILRTAPNLTGPWTDPHDAATLYRVPEMQAGPKHDKNIFCYAGKEHPELEASGDIVFTYVCNTFSPPELTSRPDIYLPQIIREPMMPTASR